MNHIQPAARPSREPLLRRAGRTLLLGFSQIFFQAQMLPGLLILAAFAVASWQMALLALLGCAASTVTGLLMRAPAAMVRAGDHGFCGALVGAAAFAAIGGGLPGAIAALLGGAACAPVTWGFQRFFRTALLGPLKLPSITAPFCLVAGILFFATADRRVAPAYITMDGSPVALFLRSILANVSQVVLIDSVIAGGLILAALFLAQWKVGLAALVGSVLSSVIAVATGADPLLLGHGMLGYSSVLVAIAMAALFVAGSWQPWALAAVGALLAAGLSMLTQGVPALYTWPFVVVTWLLLTVVHFVPGLKRSRPGSSDDAPPKVHAGELS
ncbi:MULTISPECIES: urea transporter [Arthrobacter]|uniref:urea transporter n=1 Tax=Arthrobacter TaxID=1663 RepID=UPI0011B3FC42|nr:urea transporter [Arthrobacter psychrochitiniphilus]NYG18835.1 urea transporter [Arthrobacter psychrochitiniphilus]